MAPDTGTLELSRIEAERQRLEEQDRTRHEAREPAEDEDSRSIASRIVAEVLDAERALRDVVIPDDPSGLFEDDAPSDQDVALADEHRTYWAMLEGDSPIVLLPGRATRPDGDAFTPTPDRLGPTVDRALAPLARTRTATAAAAIDDEPLLGRAAGRTAAWAVLAAVWAAAAAALVPLMFEGAEAAIDFRFDIWGQ
jgi:hypothetical protein